MASISNRCARRKRGFRRLRKQREGLHLPRSKDGRSLQRARSGRRFGVTRGHHGRSVEKKLHTWPLDASLRRPHGCFAHRLRCTTSDSPGVVSRLKIPGKQHLALFLQPRTEKRPMLPQAEVAPNPHPPPRPLWRAICTSFPLLQTRMGVDHGRGAATRFNLLV